MARQNENAAPTTRVEGGVEVSEAREQYTARRSRANCFAGETMDMSHGDGTLPLWIAADARARREGLAPVADPPPQPAPRRPRAPRRRRVSEPLPTAEVIPIGLARNHRVVGDLVRAAGFDKPEHRVEVAKSRIRVLAEDLVRSKGVSPVLAERERILLTARVLESLWSLDHSDGGAA
ncbi:hypothetical protein L1787_17850 [Acuticoccus sp. M5D2P5]|uniref:hypothetical protein n=1 Tax=Acuticoccus kalidii TaxID=2910977 RepID=UPI001F48752B|nr:hypothetical protein [Acuticoccus kalidii]MCF3935267.1 hypothetical protein [Acuticoccus kalidii]